MKTYENLQENFKRKKRFSKIVTVQSPPANFTNVTGTDGSIPVNLTGLEPATQYTVEVTTYFGTTTDCGITDLADLVAFQTITACTCELQKN